MSWVERVDPGAPQVRRHQIQETKAFRVLIGLLLLTLLTLAGGASVNCAHAAGPETGLDGRAWEMVSSVDKGGGQVSEPGSAGGAFQAAAAGGAVAYASDASFADGAGAPPVSQYVAQRGVEGWTTINVSPPLLSGTYASGAYQLLSEDLSRALLSNGWRCRDGGAICEAENPPLAPGAPTGYRTLYMREGQDLESLLTVANSPALSVLPESFELSLQGATPDLRHVVLSTCAALTSDAVEVTTGTGCDATATNLYRWSAGTLSAVNLLPGEAATAPRASLAAPGGAISGDGSRVYWVHDGSLYLRDGTATRLVAPGADFQAASVDGSVSFYLVGGHLHRFDAASGSTDLTPAGGVQGVLGTSATGSHVYYLASSGLFLRQGATVTQVAATADVSNLPAATGAARVTADGSRLAFVSSASLTGYPNAGKSQVYLYEAPADRLVCVSCNPQGTPPAGPSTISGARAAAEGPPAYKPRALSADGRRLFFDSADRLVAPDTDGAPDVYEWEAQGKGTCAQAGGCLGLISFGRTGADFFLDADAEGTDAFFLTGASLVSTDLGGLDVYDARAGGGFSEPLPRPPCDGDTCQPLLPPPADVTPGTMTNQGLPNPAPRFTAAKKKKRQAKKRKQRHRRNRGARRGGRR